MDKQCENLNTMPIKPLYGGRPPTDDRVYTPGGVLCKAVAVVHDDGHGAALHDTVFSSMALAKAVVSPPADGNLVLTYYEGNVELLGSDHCILVGRVFLFDSRDPAEVEFASVCEMFSHEKLVQLGLAMSALELFRSDLALTNPMRDRKRPSGRYWVKYEGEWTVGVWRLCDEVWELIETMNKPQSAVMDEIDERCLVYRRPFDAKAGA